MSFLFASGAPIVGASAAVYGIMLACACYLITGYQEPWVGWVVLFMSMAVIGVHGMLSGTASMDFGGTKNVGVAVGIIDGFVYAGTAVMSFTYGAILPEGDAQAVLDNWTAWPVAMIPVAILGLVLARRVWNATPQAKTAAS